MYDNNEYQISKERRINRLACDKVAQKLMRDMIDLGVVELPKNQEEYLFRFRQISNVIMKGNYPE